ncbi:Twin-arginine translocation pathway signal [uncultured Desulfobacterium sp.]|uniref:Twin-arginine translocation pathway signal n=1 Tax=uncultured Desulfobacterium sp. TaxID=201089 RepID=A0A445N1M7_9BACT|nr:Twin-arginine translocation pathway signal [uncultured Desulfobacterium sp.]
MTTTYWGHPHKCAMPLIFLSLVFYSGISISPNPAVAASAAEINQDVQVALKDLYSKSTSARTLGQKAKGILVFPSIVKGGFIVGGQYGEGALLRGGKTVGYYNTVQASYGLQAGLQKYGYALFLMTDSALNYINKSDGWEIGVGPTIVVIDTGASASATTTTLQSEIYAFFFDQKGLMAGIGLQGTKITKIEK